MTTQTFMIVVLIVVIFPLFIVGMQLFGMLFGLSGVQAKEDAKEYPQLEKYARWSRGLLRMAMPLSVLYLFSGFALRGHPRLADTVSFLTGLGLLVWFIGSIWVFTITKKERRRLGL